MLAGSSSERVGAAVDDRRTGAPHGVLRSPARWRDPVRPALQGQASATLDAEARGADTRDRLAEQQCKRSRTMTEQYQQEVDSWV